MRIRVLEFEGTPEELAKVDLDRLVARDRDAPAEVFEDPDPLVNRFLEEVSAFGDVRVTPGPKYLRIHRAGARAGAFAYLWPRNRRINFRLERNHAGGAARARSVDAKSPYKVMLILDERSIEQALDLAKKAWEAVSQ